MPQSILAQNQEQPSPRSKTPLHILLPTLGSAGDVHPLIELGTALQNRGHRVAIVTNPFFEGQIRDSGVGFVPLGTVEEGEATIADPRLWHPTKSFECLVERVIVPNLARLYRIIEEHCAPNLVVGASGLCFGARIAQEKLGIRLATIHLQPAMLRSLVDGGRQGRIPFDRSIPRPIKQFLYWLVDATLVDRLLGPPMNSFRAVMGLPPVKGILKHFVHSPDRVIGLFPDWFAPVQPDWPPNTRLTGFVLHDDAARRAPSPELEEFLASGPPPVLFTPGSAAATLAGFFRSSVDACRQANLRALLVTNYPGQLPRTLPANMLASSYVPFSQILSRCAALVYPGGVGTMAQAIRAGIPHLVVPHGHDQPDNAFRIEQLGLGVRLYPERYQATRVARLLTGLLDPSAIRKRCAEFAPRIESAAAIQRACDLLEGLHGGVQS